MARSPISGLPTTFVKNAGGSTASSYWLKLYGESTSIPILIYFQEEGGPSTSKVKLNTLGIPLSNSNDNDSIFVPYVDQNYIPVLYSSADDADNNNTSAALWVGNSITISTNLSVSAENTVLDIDDIETNVGNYLNDINIDNFTELRIAMANGRLGIGASVRVKSTGGPPGSIVNVGSYVDNGGTVIVSGGYAWVRDYSGLPVADWFNDDLNTDFSIPTQACLDALGAVSFGPTVYLFENPVDLSGINNCTISGVGSAGNDSDTATVLRATFAGTIFAFNDRLARLDMSGIRFDSSVAGATGIKQTIVVEQSQNYLDNSRFSDLRFTQSMSMCIDANMIACQIERCNFHQSSGTGGAASTRVAIQSLGTPSDTSTRVSESNANVIRDCSFYNGLNPDSGQVILYRGSDWTIEGRTIFETISGQSTRFIFARGIASLSIKAWFESTVSQDYMIQIGTDSSAAPQGTNAIFLPGCEFNMSHIEEACVRVGSASDTFWQDGVRFSGSGSSNYAVEKSNIKGDGWSRLGTLIYSVSSLRDTLFGYAGAANIREKSLRSDHLISANAQSNPQNACQMISNNFGVLTDDPVSAQDIIKFTLPDTGAGEQRLVSGDFFGTISVSDVDSTLSIINNMSILIHANMYKHSTQVNASANITVINTLGTIGSPDVQVRVDGNDVYITFEHNPSGGSFSNGITGVISGTFNQASTSVSNTDYIDYSSVS